MVELRILPVAILLTFMALLLLPVAEAAFAAVRRRGVRCPATGELRSVGFVERAIYGIVAPVDVVSCSAVRDPADLTCGKACLGLFPLLDPARSEKVEEAMRMGVASPHLAEEVEP